MGSIEKNVAIAEIEATTIPSVRPAVARPMIMQAAEICRIPRMSDAQPQTWRFE
jgi:hypothetical protein